MMDPIAFPEPRPPAAGALARARAAMLGEAQRPRGRGWLASVAQVAGVAVALLSLVGVAGLFTDAFPAQLMVAHLPSMVVLASVMALLWVAAFSPERRVLRLVSLAAGAIAMGLIVVLRPEVAGLDTSRFTCTVSHLGVALLPALVTVAALRRAAFKLSRALAAGLGVGAVGAFAGELGCHQGPVHVLLFHLSAWVISSALVLIIASKVKPRSFAP